MFKNKYFLLTILILAYILSFTDRNILYFLLPNIQQDLKLSLFESSLLGGAAFGIFYGIMALPMGYFASKYSRPKLVAVCLLLWSIATAMCGIVNGFLELLFFRAVVGIGEAGLSPCAYSLINEQYSEKRKNFVLGIYSTAVYLGMALAYILGGYFTKHQQSIPFKIESLTSYYWQDIFVNLGITGILLSFLFLNFKDIRTQVEQNSVFKPLIKELKNNKYSLLKQMTASGFFNIGVYSLGIWMPTFIVQQFKLSSVESGNLLALYMLTAAPLGVIIGSLFNDYIFRKTSNRLSALFISLPLIAIAFTFLLFPFSVNSLKILLFILTFTLGFPVTATLSLVLNETKKEHSATVSSTLLMFQNLIGISLGPLISGLLVPVYGFQVALGLTGVSSTTLSFLLFYNSKNKYNA